MPIFAPKSTMTEGEQSDGQFADFINPHLPHRPNVAALCAIGERDSVLDFHGMRSAGSSVLNSAALRKG